MLFRVALHKGLRDGSITVAFRCWKRPSVRAGSTLRTPVGVLAIDEVALIGLDDIRPADVSAAGAPSLDALVAELCCEPGRDLYRIRFHRAGDDPRLALRASADLTEDECAAITTTLEGWDRRSRTGPWTREVLALIDERPGVVSTELADTLGLERFDLKRRIRRLKDLGLTESLEVGYRLSPRGRALVERWSQR